MWGKNNKCNCTHEINYVLMMIDDKYRQNDFSAKDSMDRTTESVKLLVAVASSAIRFDH